MLNKLNVPVPSTSAFSPIKDLKGTPQLGEEGQATCSYVAAGVPWYLQ